MLEEIKIKERQKDREKEKERERKGEKERKEEKARKRTKKRKKNNGWGSESRSFGCQRSKVRYAPICAGCWL